jgi:branched-chain amino acid transport system ATP-binding protein
MTQLLELQGVTKSFKGLVANEDIGFTVGESEIVGLIGPNGAGKTTLFNMIAGVFPPDRGSIRLKGRSLVGMKPHQACAAGIGRTFQIVRPFPHLTVAENVLIGALHAEPKMARAHGWTDEVLALVGLKPKAGQKAGTLTLPERKCLEVARALATRPKLLLLDEVMAGLRPSETDQMVAIFKRLNQETGLAILLVEHVMRAVMALSHRVVVINSGRYLCEGSPAEVVKDPRVLECYLGGEEPA